MSDKNDLSFSFCVCGGQFYGSNSPQFMLNCIYVDSQIDSPNISKFTRESLDFSFEQLTIMHAFIIEGFMIFKKSQFPFSLQRISLQTCSPIQVLGRRLALCCAWGGPLCPQAAGLREKGPLQHTWRREPGSDQTPVSTGVTLQAGGSSMHQVHVSGWARVDATCF